MTARDERLIDERLSCSDHDYFVWAGLLGEPFLHDDILSYFDAETASVVGVPLLGESVDSADWQRRLRTTIRRWLDSPDVRFLSYWGPYRLPDSALPGWSPVFTEEPVEWNVDVFLDLERSAGGLQEKKARENLRRAQRNDISLWIGRRPSLNAEHLGLLRALAARDSLGIQDVNSLSNVVSILRSDATTVFEARCAGRLAGFCIGHRYFSLTPFAVAAAFDRRHRGAADLVLAGMIQHYAGLGARRFGLGYAYDEGSYSFKTKWGGASVGAPFHELIWQRPGAEREFNGCLQWPWRLLSRQLACDGRCVESELHVGPAVSVRGDEAC